MIQFSKLMKDLATLMLDGGYPMHVPTNYVLKIRHGAYAKLICFLYFSSPQYVLKSLKGLPGSLEFDHLVLKSSINSLSLKSSGKQKLLSFKLERNQSNEI